VALSETTMAVTDGRSAMFKSRTAQTWSSYAWPFPVNVVHGVVGVKSSMSADTDESGEETTGLLGCQCVDEWDSVFQLSSSISLVCATIPLLGNGLDDDGLYNMSTVHNVIFESGQTRDMTCARTSIHITPLRFARRRMAVSAGLGRDVDEQDPYNIFGDGASQTTPFVADTAIYIQPMCGGSDSTCLVSSQSCYPWCMGLHVAGIGGQNISIFNAMRWEEYVSVRQTDCGIELNRGAVTECEDGDKVIVNTLKDGKEETIQCTLKSKMCVTNDLVSTSIPIQQYEQGPTSMAAHKADTGPVVRKSAQPFVASGDVILTYADDEIIVTRLYDAGGGVFGIGEELTLVRNKKVIPTVTCMGSDSACISEGVIQGKVMRPVSYFEYTSGRIPSATSKWGVHWAINPDLGVLSPYTLHNA